MTATLEPRQSSPADREREISAAIENFETQRRKWAEAPGNAPPGVAFWIATADIVHSYAAGPIPRRYMPATSIVEKIGLLLEKLASNSEISFAEFMPTGGLFSLTEQMTRVIEENEASARPLESVADLLKQEVSIEQIARIHCMSPDDVLQEKKEPGSVCKPGADGAPWVSPAIAKAEADKREAAREWSNGVVLSAVAEKLRAFGLGTVQRLSAVR